MEEPAEGLLYARRVLDEGEEFGEEERPPVLTALVVRAVRQDVRELHREGNSRREGGCSVGHQRKREDVVEHGGRVDRDAIREEVHIKGGHVLEQPRFTDAVGERGRLFCDSGLPRDALAILDALHRTRIDFDVARAGAHLV